MRVRAFRGLAIVFAVAWVTLPGFGLIDRDDKEPGVLHRRAQLDKITI